VVRRAPAHFDHFGYRDVVMVRGRTRRLLATHQRVHAPPAAAVSGGSGGQRLTRTREILLELHGQLKASGTGTRR